MKRVLILRDRIQRKNRDTVLLGFLKRRFFSKVEFEMKRLTEVAIAISPGQLKVKVGRQKIDDFDFIWLRKTGRYTKLAIALVGCLEHLGKRYCDTALGKRSISGDKLINLVHLAKAGLPIPPSFFCRQNSAKLHLPQITGLGFPLVAKLLDRHWGRAVYLLKDKDDLADFLRNTRKKPIIFQKYFPPAGDYRILVLGNKIGAWEKEKRADNWYPAAVGGIESENFYPPEKIPPKLKDLAIKAAKLLQIEVAGVDVIQEAKTGRYYLIEVNRDPALSITYPGDPELTAVADFFQATLKI